MKELENLAEAVKRLKDNVVCPICFEILMEPISTKCNHHFCSSCHKKLFQSRRKHSCPVCHAPLTRRSCAKNSLTLNPIVQAVKSLIDCLKEDTGIDFSNEVSPPVFSKEAACDNMKDGGSKLYELNVNKESDQIKSHSSSYGDVRKIEDTTNIFCKRDNKGVKKYQGKRQIITHDDSFMFPVDFLVSNKKTDLEVKPPLDRVSNKVSSWLNSNEKDLNDFEEMSILNGSLPKKVVVDLNSSFSDEELLSVSQVNANCKSKVSPAKSKQIALVTVDEEPKNEVEPEFKDPYEFISSQKSKAINKMSKPVKRARRATKNSGLRKKPLGLDISHLISEFANKRKLNASGFPNPVSMNDTFDQLISISKKPLKSACEASEATNTKDKEKNSNDNEALVNPHQNIPHCQTKSSPNFTSKNDKKTEIVPQEKVQDESSRSPGWSRVNAFSKNLPSKRRPLKSLRFTERMKNKQCISLDNVESHNVSSKNRNSVDEAINTSVEINERNEKENDSSAEELPITVTSPVKSPQSPEEPVRFFELSQSEVRAKIMNDVVKSFESSLKKAMEVGCEDELSTFDDRHDGSDELELMPSGGVINKYCSNENTPTIRIVGPKINSSHVATSETPNEEPVEIKNKESDSDVPVPVKGILSMVQKDEVNSSNKKIIVEINNKAQDYHSSSVEKNSSEMSVNDQDSCIEFIPVDIPQCLSENIESKLPEEDIMQPKSGSLLNTIKEVGSKEQGYLSDCQNNNTLTATRINLDKSIGNPSIDVEPGKRIIFFKVGKYASKLRPRIKFWLLGSCMTSSERQGEVTQWIIKVSKSKPICHCDYSKSESVSFKQPSTSFSHHNVANRSHVTQHKKRNLNMEMDVEKNVTQASVVSVENSELKVDSSSPSDIKRGYCGEKRNSEKSVVDNGSFNGVLATNDVVTKTENNKTNIGVCANKENSLHTQAISKSSHEDVFQSGRNNGVLLNAGENKCNDIFSQSSLFEDNLPKNKIVEADYLSSIDDGDDILASHGNEKSLQKSLCLDDRKLASDDSVHFQKRISDNDDENVVLLENLLPKIAETDMSTNYHGNKVRGHYPIPNIGPQDDTKINNTQNEKNSSEKDSNTDKILFENFKSPNELDKSYHISGNIINTEEDIFHSDNVILQDNNSSSIGTPEILTINRKRVRPLDESPSSSEENGAKCKSMKRLCNVNDSKAAENKNKVSNKRIHSKNLNNSDIEDDDNLNSEELLHRLMDNMNEDLGFIKRVTPEVKKTRRKILVDSEDEKCNVSDKKHPNLSNSPEYGDEKNNLEDDIFKDNEKDVIEESPKSTSKIFKNKKEIEKCSNEKQQHDKISSEDSSRFILPHSSLSKMKADSAPSVKLVASSKKDVSLIKLDTITKSPQKFFGSPCKRSLAYVDKNTMHNQERFSPRNESNLQKLQKKMEKSETCTVKSLNVKNKLIFVCSGLLPSVVTKVKRFAQICGAGFSDNFCIGATHLIVNVDENKATPKTLKYLKAVAAKKWIVSYDWVLACISAHKLVPEEEFEAIDILGVDGPRRSRLSSSSLFKNVQVCFLEPFNSITLDDLQDLFMMCGGMIVDSPEGFSVSNRDIIRIIVSDMEENEVETSCQKWLLRNRAVTVISDWVLDSIGTHMLQPLGSYLLAQYKKEQLQACGIPESLLLCEDLESTVVS